MTNATAEIQAMTISALKDQLAVYTKVASLKKDLAILEGAQNKIVGYFPKRHNLQRCANIRNEIASYLACV